MLGNSEVPGIFPLAVSHVFDQVPANTVVAVTCFEIYCNRLHDLLNSKNVVHARDNGIGQVVIQGVHSVEATTYSELMSRISGGLAERTVGVTFANSESSRSHTVVEIRLPCMAEEGKLTFIDLAGSERAADVVDQDKKVRLDGAEINKSLLALKECIRAMDQGLEHQKFRGAKLTQVLKDSFVGNCHTTMIANISPSSGACEDTLNTLRYANRVKSLPQCTISKKAVLPTKPQARLKHRPKHPPVKQSRAPPARASPIRVAPIIRPRSPLSPRNGHAPSTPSSAPSYDASMDYAPVARIENFDRASGPDEEDDFDDFDPIEFTGSPSSHCHQLLQEERLLVRTHRDWIDTLLHRVEADSNLLDRIEAGEVDVRAYLSEVERSWDETNRVGQDLQTTLGKMRSLVRGGKRGSSPRSS
jgi:kinesin family member 2/24